MNVLFRAANFAGKPLGINSFPRAFANPGTGEAETRADAFDNIFAAGAWNSEESVSGPGSEEHRAADYRRRFQQQIDVLHVDSVFDAPCGDLNWILPAVQSRHYAGGDISRSLIAKLQLNHPHLDLSVFDICEDAFPKADVWHCRDCLFHLPFTDIRKALRNFASSDISYAFITSHRTRLRHRNLDIPIGGWRYLDLNIAPIGLPEPMVWLKDYRRGIDFPRYVGVWKREQIHSVVF